MFTIITLQFILRACCSSRRTTAKTIFLRSLHRSPGACAARVIDERPSAWRGGFAIISFFEDYVVCMLASDAEHLLESLLYQYLFLAFVYGLNGSNIAHFIVLSDFTTTENVVG